MFGYHPGRVMRYGYRGAKAIREAKFRRMQFQALRRLKDAKLVAERREGNRIAITLTEKGVLEVIRLRILDAEMFDDNRFCIVAFDIPESRRAVRYLLRQLLQKAGFAQLQKSVWISPFDVTLPLKDFLQKIGAERWTRIFVADEVPVSVSDRSAKI